MSQWPKSLSTRCVNMLKNSGAQSIAEAKALSDEVYLRLPGVGRQTLNEWREYSQHDNPAVAMFTEGLDRVLEAEREVMMSLSDEAAYSKAVERRDRLRKALIEFVKDATRA